MTESQISTRGIDTTEGSGKSLGHRSEYFFEGEEDMFTQAGLPQETMAIAQNLDDRLEASSRIAHIDESLSNQRHRIILGEQ